MSGILFCIQARTWDTKQRHILFACVQKTCNNYRIWILIFGWDGCLQVQTWVWVTAEEIVVIFVTQMLHLPPEYVCGAIIWLQRTLLCKTLAFQGKRKLMSWQAAFMNSQVLSQACSYTLIRRLFVQPFSLLQLCGKLHDTYIHCFKWLFEIKVYRI